MMKHSFKEIWKEDEQDLPWGCSGTGECVQQETGSGYGYRENHQCQFQCED